MGVKEPDLIFDHPGVGVGQIGSSLAQAFYFRALQHQTGLIYLGDPVIEPGAFIPANDFSAVIFPFSHCQTLLKIPESSSS